MAATRVLLVDDESLVRRILKQILAGYPDMELVGEAANGEEAIAAVERFQPDIVVMDIRMPALDGIAAAREIRIKYPKVKMIGLSEYAYSYNTDAMERAGAAAVYQKSMAFEELYAAIKKVTAVDPAYRLHDARPLHLSICGVLDHVNRISGCPVYR